MLLKETDGQIGRFRFTREHIGIPAKLVFFKWDLFDAVLFHIIIDEIYSNGDAFVLFYHFMAQAESAGFKYNIRFESGFPTFINDQVVNLELAAFYIQWLIFQIFNGNGRASAQRMRLVNQKHDRE